MFNDNISLFGDSIGAGVITDKDARYFSDKSAVKLLERKFGVTIDNRSKFGQTLAKTVKRGMFDCYVRDGAGEDAVAVIELGGNDSAYSWKEVADFPYHEHGPITPLDDFTDYLAQSIRLLKRRAKVYCCNLVPVHSQLYFDNVIGSICDKSRVLEFFKGDNTVIFRQHKLFNDSIISVCKMLDVSVIDIRTPFLDYDDMSGLLCEDGIHPNERGQALIFEAVSRRFGK